MQYRSRKLQRKTKECPPYYSASREPKILSFFYLVFQASSRQAEILKTPVSRRYRALASRGLESSGSHARTLFCDEIPILGAPHPIREFPVPHTLPFLSARPAGRIRT